jgi:hypothetical protein
MPVSSTATCGKEINNNIYTVLVLENCKKGSQEVAVLIFFLGGPTLNKMDIVCLVIYYYRLYLGPTTTDSGSIHCACSKY